MEREKEEDRDRDDTLKGYARGATISNMRQDARD